MHRPSRILPFHLPQTPATASRFNFVAGVLNGTFYILAEALMEPNLVLATFISYLTPSPFWVGLIMPLRDGSWFLPQLWVSTFQQNMRYKLPLYRQMILVRLIGWVVMAFSVFLITDTTWLLIIFFISFSVAALASGISGLAFLEIVGKTVPAIRRGEYFAWRLATGGLAGLGGSLVVSWLLAENLRYPFPINFGLLFTLALGMAAIGLYAFAVIREPPSEDILPRISFLAQLKHALALVKADHNFRRFIYLRSTLILGGAATPFFAVYVQQTFHAPLSSIALYLATYTASNLVCNFAFTRLAPLLGNHRTMGVSVLSGLVMTLVVVALLVAAALSPLSSGLASAWLVPVFILLGLKESSSGVAGQSLLLDLAPPQERGVYLGFTNSFIGIVLLATGLSGLIVQFFGFTVLLGLTFLAHLAALVALGRMTEVKQG